MMDESTFGVHTGDRDDLAAVHGVPSVICGASASAIALLSPVAIPGKTVAQLVVRNLPEDLVKALKQRAARNNRSAEQEHREILRAALRGPRRRSLADVLASMPNVGRDEDFARDQDDSRG